MQNYKLQTTTQRTTPKISEKEIFIRIVSPKIKMVEKICRLCFESKAKQISISTGKGVKLKIASIIRTHVLDEITDNDGLPKTICSECWMKLSDFHEFYNSVVEARKIYLEKFVRESSPNFLEIKCGDIACGDDIPSNSVKSEPIDDDVVKVEASKSSPVNDNFENHDESQNSPNDFSHAGDIFNDNEERDVNFDEEFGVDGWSKEEDDTPSAERFGTSLFSVNKTKTERDNFDELAPNYMEMACELCKHPFKRLSEARKHYRVKHKQRNVRIKCCQKRIDLYDIVEHIQYHLNPNIFKCDECGRCFLWSRDLKRHRTSHQPKQFQCDICKKMVSARHILKEHILKLHTNAERQYECHICKTKFTFQHILHNHILRKHSKNLLQNECETCKKSFISKNALRTHIKGTHEGRYQQVCHICAKVYSSKHSLLMHLKDHSAVKEPRVTCNICGRSYKNLKGLNSHIATHNERKQIFQCPHCPKISPNRNALAKHIGSMHNFKIHKCHLCDKEFKQAIVLKEHVASHSGTYLYICNYCPQKFKYRNKMYLHNRKFHPLEWCGDRTRDPTKMHDRLTSDE